MCAAFWWGDREEKKCMHWTRWTTMCTPKSKGGLGFKDLRKFNLVLLAKQLWRIKYPSSLVARIFRARYGKDEDILKARAKPHCSYIWRSLPQSREIVERGLRWRIGNGQKVKIFKDRWSMGVGNETLKGKGDGLDQNARVNSLISEEGDWKEDIVHKCFYAHEAMAILNTPIREKGLHDERYWAYEQSGTFSVKSAYLLQIGHYNEHEEVSKVDMKWWSSQVWTLSIPPKAKIFMWRALNNIIPTAANLKEHHTPSDGVCDLCNDRWGSTTHAIIFCPKVRAVCKASSFWKLLNNDDMSELHVLADVVKRSYGKDRYEIWCLMLWKVWQSVCKYRHEQGRVMGTTSEEECEIVWEEFQNAARAYIRTTDIGVKCGDHFWSKPRHGIFRVDVDASFNPQSNTYGVEVIVRDWNGKIMVALS